jgi:hypothetical protein
MDTTSVCKLALILLETMSLLVVLPFVQSLLWQTPLLIFVLIHARFLITHKQAYQTETEVAYLSVSQANG